MSLQLIPIDRETGEVLEFRPSMIKELSNADLRDLLATLKSADKLRKEGEKEVLNNKKLISEIQASNSENISYKEKYEKLLVETEGNAKVAKLARDLFMELSLGN